MDLAIVRRRILLSVLLTGILLLGLKLPRKRPSALPPKADPPAPAITTSRPPGDTAAKPLIGQTILKHYNDPARPPEQDLTDMAHALDNFALLVKGDNPLPLGANEEIANALLGKNRVQLQFLPQQHPAINARGQLIDRWGTPLFFHAKDRQRLDIRSAGPDRIMWTADDIHRLHDGRFLRGEDLLAPSLFGSSN